MIEKYSNKNIDDKKLIFIKFNLIYWFECWLFNVLQLTSIEIYLYFTIYEMNSFDVELDSYLSRFHVVRWISRDETLRESFSRTLVLRSFIHFVIRSLKIWAWSLNRWVRLIEDLAETIEKALLDLRETVRWLDVAYSYSGRGRNICESYDASNRRQTRDELVVMTREATTNEKKTRWVSLNDFLMKNDVFYMWWRNRISLLTSFVLERLVCE
jgi:hypothetical protein